MRALGIHERYITGTATDEEKFNQWAGAIPYTIRNPLFHWSHLELKRYFGIDQLLTSETASGIYRAANSLLGQPEYSTQDCSKR
ncbi:MAG: glucuronate isomerase [Cyclobacteriaceae bacterium]